MNTLILLFFILGLNLLAYLSIYPRLVKSDFKRLMLAELILSALALLVVGAKYAGTDTRFNLMFFETNWFVATLLFDMLIESVLLHFYRKRYPIALLGDKPKHDK